MSKADFSSRNARVSLIGLIALGLGACAAIVYNIDNWLAGGAAVKRVAETCNVLGSGCSNAVTSIFKIIGSPQLILLTVAVAALIAAAIKAVFVVASARKVAQRYFHTAKNFHGSAPSSAIWMPHACVCALRMIVLSRPLPMVS